MNKATHPLRGGLLLENCMKLTAKQAFSWAHRGIDVVHYEAGQEIETDDQDLIAVSQADGWAVSRAEGWAVSQAEGWAESQAEGWAESEESEAQPKAKKAAKAAPENKQA